MLCLGGGPGPRHFQQSSQFIFCVNNSGMKRKIGGVAYIAQRKFLDGSPKVIEQALSISDMNNLLQYLDPAIVSPSIVVSENFGNVSGYNKNDEMEMQKLIRRLLPYSQSLQGTAPHIAYERTKLMAMIPSPIINKHGLWRLFFTVLHQIYMRADFLKLSVVQSLIVLPIRGFRELKRSVIDLFIFLLVPLIIIFLF